MFWEMECVTCGLKLENGKVPTRCGLDGYQSRQAAVKMGSLNALLWEAREELTRWQGCLRVAVAAERINYFLDKQEWYRERILLLMREKRNPDKYADLVKWDEDLKVKASKTVEQ